MKNRDGKDQADKKNGAREFSNDHGLDKLVMADYDVMLIVVIPGEAMRRPGIQGNCFISCFQPFWRTGSRI